jgi:hypothetical protein
MPGRIFRDRSVDSVPHLFEKCPVIVDLCLPVLTFPRIGIMLVEQSLSDCECVWHMDT